ncbi:cysteine desulfurase [Patescibacteria group bacterium]|nr:cysteine desulfurase [Patescibacteria group bacterium]
MKKIYLDYSATTPVDRRVMKSMQPYFSKTFANASSLHSAGKLAQQALVDSRQKIANLLGVSPEEIIFTASGSEANNLAFKGIFNAIDLPKKHIITSSIEHSAVLNPARFLEGQGAQVTYLGVSQEGIIDLGKLKNSLKPQTVLISIMHANNEMGAIQPLAEIGEIIKQEKEKRKKEKNNYPLYFHTDAVQTLGHLPFLAQKWGVDLFSGSAHKLYGPKGVGLLYLKKGIKIIPLFHGGAHENGKRASTENIPGIVGFARALELAYQEMDSEVKRLKKLRDYLIESVLKKIENSCLNGPQAQRLPNNANLSFAGVEGEALLMYLDRQQIYCSTGSACSSASLAPSHVLTALNLPPEISHSSLRFSLGRWTNKKEIDYLLEKLILAVKNLREISALKINY